jgi:hypothetical protein
MVCQKNQMSISSLITTKVTIPLYIQIFILKERTLSIIQIEVMEKTFVYEQINNCLDNEGKDRIRSTYNSNV